MPAQGSGPYQHRPWTKPSSSQKHRMDMDTYAWGRKNPQTIHSNLERTRRDARMQRENEKYMRQVERDREREELEAAKRRQANADRDTMEFDTLLARGQKLANDMSEDEDENEAVGLRRDWDENEDDDDFLHDVATAKLAELDLMDGGAPATNVVVTASMSALITFALCLVPR